MVAVYRRDSRAHERAAPKEIWPLRFYPASAILLLIVTAVSLWFANLNGGVPAEAAVRQADVAEKAERPLVALESAIIVHDGDRDRVSMRLHNYGGGPAWAVEIESLGLATPAIEGSCDTPRDFSTAKLQRSALIRPGQTIELNERLSPSGLARKAPGFLAAVVDYGSAIEKRWHCEVVFFPLGSDPLQDFAHELKPDEARGINERCRAWPKRFRADESRSDDR